MKKITFKEYKEALKQQYEIAKKADVSGILAHPSPAQMRTFCSIAFDKGLSKKDEEVFKLFFETKENESVKKSIEQCNIDKFRPVISFLKGESDSENSIRIEMAAILIHFQHRPYSIFINSADFPSNHSVETTKEHLTFSENTEVMQMAETSTLIRNSKRKMAIGLLSALGLFSVGYTTKNVIFPTKECMKWCEDHYELVDCIQETHSVGDYGTFVPYDNREFERRELTICDTTDFFVDGNSKKPKVWYDKEKDGLRYFNMSGVNPETGDHLRPITEYMLEKYVERSN